MGAEPLISLENVGCIYKIRHGILGFRHYQAVKDVSLSINKGETLGLIGGNGAGKSTLLHLIAGIILPNSGRIIHHQPASISLLNLQLGFSPELSGRDNAIMGAMLLGYSKKQALERLGRIVEFSGLGNWFVEPLKTYSSGMKARLGFAVAMEVSPDVLLVDEVLGVGDERFRKKSTQAMKDKMQSGQTVVFVSHHKAALRELCSRVAWIEAGVTRAIGTPREVLAEYHRWSKTQG